MQPKSATGTGPSAPGGAAAHSTPSARLADTDGMTDEAAPPDRRAFALSDLVPPRAPRAPLSALRPGGPVQAAVLAALLILTLGYVAYWCYEHRAMLIDLDRQNDDARQHLFHYHTHRGDGALAGDPVTEDARLYSPPAVRAVYRVLVPVTGLFAASKLVQGATWAIVLVGAWVLGRAERGGWAAACLFLFFMLHTPEIANRMVGGMPRGFAYPLIGLWLAGAIARSERTRWAAGIVGGAVYPFAMLLILGGEGFLRLAGGVDVRRRDIRANWLRYVLMIALCFAAVMPYQFEKGDRGKPPTYAQAAADPAFGPEGRTKQLPFPNPVRGVVTSMSAVVLPDHYAEFHVEPRFPFLMNHRWAMLGLGLLAIGGAALVATRRSPLPVAGLSLFAASLVLTAAAQLMAFRLYIPARYYEFGMPVATIGLLVGVYGLLGVGSDDGRRRVARWAAAIAVMLVTLFFSGTGTDPDNALRLDRKRDAPLYDFVESLPLDARIASHPHDGNDLPYWAARATVVSRETLIPWMYPTWPARVEVAADTLRAMYATRRGDVVAYIEAHDVSHILIHKRRYREDFADFAGLFEPLNRVTDEALEGVELHDLVLADVPLETVVYEDETWRLVDAERLAEAWSEGAAR